ncbi:IPT/TIG domain-containing protein [Streptomyces sp. NPDC048411]|uniref:IPT/TIG domain-containing protein n=1 Tax=Streptomyces sp. NPDC048411 TaxID=3157206 RepID=UPI0034553021
MSQQPHSAAAVAATLPTPTLTVVHPDQRSGSGCTTVNLRGSGFTGATAVRFGTDNAVSFDVLSDTAISATSPASSGTVQVAVTTPGGTSNSLSFSLPAAPTLSAVAPNQGPVSGGATSTLTGTNLTGATAVSFGGAAASFTAVSATQITATTPPGTAGPTQVTVTTPGGTSSGLSYFFLNAPTLTALSPSQGPGGTVILTGTNLTAATAVSFGGTAAASFTVVSATQITALAPVGSGTVNITVTTPGGTSNGLSYTYVAAPNLTGLAPNQGPVSGGTVVTLTGTNLTWTTAVKFGGTAAASFTVVSATQITATTPPGTAGPVQVTVTTPGGTSGGLAYFYINAPALTSAAPSQGPVSGGATVTLTGTNLTGTTAVRFGATAAASFTVVSATQITATTPPGTAGPVQVTVTTPGGTSNGLSYFFVDPPTLTALSSSQGPVSGGASVTLTGTNLIGTTAVSFDGTAASFTVDSATQITALAPVGSGTVNITVTTPGGTSNGLSYTYVAAPNLTAVAPSQGPVSGGTVVTLTGTNLTGTTAVTFGGTAASFTVVSATQVTATTPPGTAGPVQVTVTTPGGTSGGLIYSRIQPPGI